MKKHINNKVYDTDTATQVGHYSYGNGGDFDHVSETLYRKKTGEFFIHGWGGPRSRYAVAVSYSEATGSEAITPLELPEAKAWAEEHMTTAEYDKAFGTPQEDTTTKTVTFSVSTAAHENGKAYIMQNGGSLSALVSAFLAGLQ